MSRMISLYHLLQLLIFISILPTDVAQSPTLKFAFLNGLNVIRCSDQQVRVYDGTETKLTSPLTCDDSSGDDQATYTWGQVNIYCSQDENTAYEEQLIIVESFLEGYNPFSEAMAQRDPMENSYLSDVEERQHNKWYALVFKKDFINDTYFRNEEDVRQIYVTFKDSSTMCRITVPNEKTGLCPRTHPEVDNTQHVCYYNPGGSDTTIDEMEAEIKQVEDAVAPDNENPYTLNLERPKIGAPQPSSSNGGGPSQPHQSSSGKNVNAPVKPAAQPSKGKARPMKIIGAVIGVLVVALVAGVGVYLGRQHCLKGSLDTKGADNGRRGSANVDPNDSQLSLSTVASDANREVSINDALGKGKPNMELQSNAPNKRQRTGASMVFNEDV